MGIIALLLIPFSVTLSSVVNCKLWRVFQLNKHLGSYISSMVLCDSCSEGVCEYK